MQTGRRPALLSGTHSSRPFFRLPSVVLSTSAHRRCTPFVYATASYLSLPGHVYANVRQPPVSTLNLAHLIPLSAVWAGPERDEHFAAPPLFFAKTEGSTPFRFSLHVGDVGHTLIVGPTGAGKSVLLALAATTTRISGQGACARATAATLACLAAKI